jgi:hypothetical protein
MHLATLILWLLKAALTAAVWFFFHSANGVQVARAGDLEEEGKKKEIWVSHYLESIFLFDLYPRNIFCGDDCWFIRIWKLNSASCNMATFMRRPFSLSAHQTVCLLQQKQFCRPGHREDTSTWVGKVKARTNKIMRWKVKALDSFVFLYESCF